MPSFSQPDRAGQWQLCLMPRFRASEQRAAVLVRRLLPVTATILVAASLTFGFIFPLGSANHSAVNRFRYAQETIAYADQILISVDDFATAQRGFLLTEDAAFLESYDRALGSAWRAYFAIRNLTSDNLPQQNNLQNLAVLLRAKMTEVDKTIALSRSGRIEQALTVARADDGQRLMEEIREAITDISREEQRQLREQSDYAQLLEDRSTKVFIALSILAAIGFLLSGLLAARLIVGGARKRQVAADAGDRQRLLDMVNMAAVMIRTMDGTIQFWSEGCCRLYGWTGEQAIGRLSQDLLQTVFSQSPANINAALIRDGAWTGELRHRTRDGAAVTVMASKTLHDYADRTGHLVVETLTDVTAWRRTQVDLQDNEARFGSLVDTALDGFVIASLDGQIESINRAMLNLFGYDRAEELIGRNLDVLMPLKERDRRESYIASHNTGGPPRAISLPGRELTAVRRDGSEFPIDLSVSSFATDDSRHLTGIIRDATARRQAETALRDSEARQRDLLLTLGLGTFMARDLDGRIQYWAEGCERLYGWTSEEAIGQISHKLLGTIFPVPVSEIEATLERAGEWTGDLRHYTRDGHELTVTAHKRLRRGENGRPGVVLEALTDVTAHRQAEIALRDNEARLRLVQQVGGIAYSDRKISEPSTLISREFAQLYGLPAEQTHISADEWIATLHPEDRVRLAEERSSVLKHGGTLVTEYRIQRSDGAIRCIALRAEAFLGADGLPLRIIGAQQDITDVVAAREAVANRQQELELRVTERTAELAAAEARFRGIFDSQSQFISLLAPDGTILEMNRSALRAAVLAREDVIGRPFWENHWWPAEQHDRLRKEIVAAKNGSLVNRDVEVKDSQGRDFWIDFSLKPVRDPATHEVMWIIAESYDLTERRNLAAQLAQAQKMQALGQLAGGIAHDFNNILQAVSGAAALIEQKPGDLERTRRLAHTAIAAARRGASITQRLLSFARRGELRATAVGTADLLISMREVLAHTLGTTITVQVDVSPAVPALIADQAQLETAIINLGTNARDAMPDGGTLILSADVEQVAEGGNHRAGLTPGDYVRLSVADDGTGMEPGTLARVSEPFFTTKGRGQGTGLGVAMVKGFAEQSGGGFWIASAPGSGTTVTIWLHQAMDNVVAMGGDEEIAVATGTSARVLLVDDDDLVRETLAATLEDAGLRTFVASNGLEAVALIESGEAVDAMVSDLSMPGINGVTTIRRVRALRPRLPCFLLTGYVGERAALSGDNTFTLVRKPVSGRVLAAQIEAVLEGARDEYKTSRPVTPMINH